MADPNNYDIEAWRAAGAVVSVRGRLYVAVDELQKEGADGEAETAVEQKPARAHRAKADHSDERNHAASGGGSEG